ncbi:MAG: DUF2937 family protein [Pseudomonadota bacterium]
MLRALTLSAGVVGAGVSAQFPGFSQQYVQRLGGAVDALGVVAADFDASAAAAGLDREQALAQLQGSAFLDSRRADMTRTIARHARLSADLAALEGQGPFTRAYEAARFTDPQIARAAWAAFEPALPLNMAGGLFALMGFLAGGTLVRTLIGLLRMPFRRAKKPEAA